MVKDWKVFVLLLLLALKLLQVSNSMKEEAFSDYRTVRLELLKAKVASRERSAIEKIYKKVKKVNAENCALVFSGSESDSKITTFFQGFVNKYSKIYGVKVRQIVWGAPQTGKYIEKLPFTLTLEGKSNNVSEFLCALSSYGKVIFVDYFDLAAYSKYVSVNLSGELLKVGNNVCARNSKNDIK